jgi:hypothetical protein
MNENEETIITLTFENAANENKKWNIAAVSGELLRDYVGRAAKQLFQPCPQRVGIATKDGAIIQNWQDKTVAEVIDQYHTNNIVIGTPDQLGAASFSTLKLVRIYYEHWDPQTGVVSLRLTYDKNDKHVWIDLKPGQEYDLKEN